MAQLAALLLVVSAAVDPPVEPEPSTVAAAALEANVDERDLLGALLTIGEPNPRVYLYRAGELEPPPFVVTQPASSKPSSSAPPGVLSRVACIEAKESGGANVANRGGSGASGVLQYMETTFARGAREIGHPEYSRWVPWQARIVAAHDLEMGRRSQWTVQGC